MQEHFWYILSAGNVSIGKHFGSFCGDQYVNLNQKGQQFKGRY